MVKDIKLWFKTLELNDFIPRGKLQLYIHYSAFIKSSIKKYNIIDKDKDILKPIKYKGEGEEVW